MRSVSVAAAAFVAANLFLTPTQSDAAPVGFGFRGVGSPGAKFGGFHGGPGFRVVGGRAFDRAFFVRHFHGRPLLLPTGARLGYAYQFHVFGNTRVVPVLIPTAQGYREAIVVRWH